MLACKGLVWLAVLGCGVSDIDADYFYGRSTRAAPKEFSCDNEVMQLYCDTKCGGNHACLFGKCFCLQLEDDHKDTVQKPAPKKEKFLDFDDYTETPLMPANTYPKRPALRHHIAHFCPNLEEARKCIRSCMKLGKPAFCGKDHVCYCGHKTETPKDDEEVDVKKIYAQFYDLYTKYFGARSNHYDSHEYDYDRH
ncbi:uncharacterized protein LOC115451658 isoform X2 [Manduca sexta]|uniref:uncharacterized protein LOC115451658 isoform X2 n=1 Tax=Manduca sexta TaxID=7130 RepID=UPI00188DDBC3|nr:uncharacterized protein LOC115451658 isoform X2 [Manduca sexta]